MEVEKESVPNQNNNLVLEKPFIVPHILVKNQSEIVSIFG